MKTKEIFTATLFIISLALTSCIKEYPDCTGYGIPDTGQHVANAILNISIPEGETFFNDEPETTIENMIVLIFNNNKKLIRYMSIEQETITEGSKNRNYQLEISATTGYHFFYVVANLPENRDFETGDHFNDIVINLGYQPKNIFVTAESPRVLLNEGNNIINVNLIQPALSGRE